MPERRTRALRPGRRFDLRSTAVFFGLLAAALVIGGLAIRALAGVLERRPVWAVVLVCLVVAVAVARGAACAAVGGGDRPGGRAGFRPGTSTALDALDAPARAGCHPRPGGGGRRGDLAAARGAGDRPRGAHTGRVRGRHGRAVCAGRVHGGAGGGRCGGSRCGCDRCDA
ncbi:hypothetical protein ACFQV4_28405 [Streptomyces thermocarboxydus]